MQQVLVRWRTMQPLLIDPPLPPNDNWLMQRKVVHLFTVNQTEKNNQSPGWVTKAASAPSAIKKQKSNKQTNKTTSAPIIFFPICRRAPPPRFKRFELWPSLPLTFSTVRPTGYKLQLTEMKSDGADFLICQQGEFWQRAESPMAKIMWPLPPPWLCGIEEKPMYDWWLRCSNANKFPLKSPEKEKQDCKRSLLASRNERATNCAKLSSSHRCVSRILTQYLVTIFRGNLCNTVKHECLW